MRKLALIILALTCLCACRHDTAASIFPANCRLQPGDVVFRKGNGTTSHIVMSADTGGAYSHVGIAVDSAGTMMSVHAVPGEPDFKGDPDRVKMETPEKFFSSVNATCGEVRRLKGDTAAARRAALYAMKVYRRGTLFDHDYDDTDTTKMYCCELVEAAYISTGITLTGGRRHNLSFPGMEIGHCIMPSDILTSPELVKISSF